MGETQNNPKRRSKMGGDVDSGIFDVRPVKKIGNSFHISLPVMFVEGFLRLSPDMPDDHLWVRFDPNEEGDGYIIRPCSRQALAGLNGDESYIPDEYTSLPATTVWEDDDTD